MLTELIPHDEASWAHLQFRQSFTALALQHDDIAARLPEQYRHLHQHDLAALIRRNQHAGAIPSSTAAEQLATGLTALAEGLSYYVLIGSVAATTARDQVRRRRRALPSGRRRSTTLRRWGKLARRERGQPLTSPRRDRKASCGLAE